MPDLHFAIFPQAQRSVWDVLVQQSVALRAGGYYLSGGTALALQLGHRQSVDFDFFSQQSGLVETTEAWLRQIPGYVVRDSDPDTLHAEIEGVKLSFIGGDQYQLLEEPLDVQGVRLAGMRDIGLMKLLAIAHGATLRDSIDLAAIFRSGCTLADLLSLSAREYGVSFNWMVPLRALTSFGDLEGEMPTLLDSSLASSWQNILREVVRTAGVQP